MEMAEAREDQGDLVQVPEVPEDFPNQENYTNIVPGCLWPAESDLQDVHKTIENNLPWFQLMFHRLIEIRRMYRGELCLIRYYKTTVDYYLLPIECGPSL